SSTSRYLGCRRRRFRQTARFESSADRLGDDRVTTITDVKRVEKDGLVFGNLVEHFRQIRERHVRRECFLAESRAELVSAGRVKVDAKPTARRLRQSLRYPPFTLAQALSGRDDARLEEDVQAGVDAGEGQRRQVEVLLQSRREDLRRH